MCSRAVRSENAPEQVEIPENGVIDLPLEIKFFKKGREQRKKRDRGQEGMALCSILRLSCALELPRAQRFGVVRRARHGSAMRGISGRDFLE